MALASFFIFRNNLIGIGLLIGGIVAALPVAAGQVCKPVLGFTDGRFSPIQQEMMERTWTAVLAVEASRRATTSGRFEILFSCMKENAPDADFVDTFTWTPGIVDMSANFSADEAVEGYWPRSVESCPCRN